MRNFIFLLLILFTTTVGLSQVNTDAKPKNPTKAEVNEQIAEAKREAQSQISALEKQIAEAKANGEDAETIKGMQDQLAMMKKILGVVDKASDRNNNPGKIETISYKTPKYVSPIVPIPFKQPVVAPTKEQAKDRLLWYRGKKLSENMLVTTSKMLVWHDRARNTIVVRPDQPKDSPIIALVNVLSRTEQLKSAFATDFNAITNSFLMYPEVLSAYEEFDLLKERYNNIAKNTIDLSASSGNWHAGVIYPTGEGSSGPFIDSEFDDDGIIDLEQMYQQLKSLLDNPPPLDFPLPPKRPNDLCLCDRRVRNQYETELSQWSEKFWGHEDQILNTFKKIHRELAINTNANVSAMPNLFSDLDRAVQIAFERRDQKVKMLRSRCGQDVYREEAVVEAVVANERAKQKFGVADLNASTIKTTVEDFSHGYFEMFIETEMANKNYNVVFDYSLYLSHEYHKQLLGGNQNPNNRDFFRWQERLSKYNRFKLIMDMEFELHFKDDQDEPSIKATGQLQSVPLIVSIGRFGCKWQLYLTTANYKDTDAPEIDFRMPVTALGGVRSVRNPVYNTWKHYEYMGPKDMLMVFPSFRFSFCSVPGPDTVILDVLRYKDDKYNHTITNVAAFDLTNPAGHQATNEDYTFEFLGLANKMLLGIKKIEMNTDQIIDITREMFSVGELPHVDKPTGNPILDEFQVVYNLNLQQHELQKKLSQTTQVDRTVILFNALNMSPTLIDEPAITNHKEIELKLELVKGKIHVKVIHDPLPN